MRSWCVRRSRTIKLRGDELMRRHATALREAAREASEGAGEADADDVVSDLWLSLIEDDMRGLRAFDPSRGAALLSWLTIRLSQLVYRREVQRASEPDSVPLATVKKLPVIPPEATRQARRSDADEGRRGGPPLGARSQDHLRHDRARPAGLPSLRTACQNPA